MPSQTALPAGVLDTGATWTNIEGLCGLDAVSDTSVDWFENGLGIASSAAVCTDFFFSVDGPLDGIALTFHGLGLALGSEEDIQLFMFVTKDGIAGVGTTYAIPAANFDSPITMGGPTDLWAIAGGVSAAEANASTFGVYLYAQSGGGAGSYSASIIMDAIELTLYYTTEGPLVGYSTRSGGVVRAGP